MKVRNGFVSNSSSSSFVLAYDKRRVYSDPAVIAEYIDTHLRDEILFHGTECCEGDDWFILDMTQKNYLLDRKKRFCKYNKGTHTATEIYFNEEKNEWDSREIPNVPYVEIYTDVYAFHGYNEEFQVNVDMSDWKSPHSYTAQEYVEKENDPEFQNAIEYSNKYYEERSKRETRIRKEERERYLNEVTQEAINSGADPDNLVVEMIQVDYNSCDPDGNSDSEFAPRYFGLDERTYYDVIDDKDEE